MFQIFFNIAVIYLFTHYILHNSIHLKELPLLFAMTDYRNHYYFFNTNRHAIRLSYYIQYCIIERQIGKLFFLYTIIFVFDLIQFYCFFILFSDLSLLFMYLFLLNTQNYIPYTVFLSRYPKNFFNGCNPF